ncbi:S-adenosyl-L-methionine-dependent methyltransferase [Metschnikowia bicuspidata var. bicuspidata NRRL YB-4993]|uniref:S-adenosyl-L-methionine-dependent methyltransferase n=1 Tax=Metschnikowia bicuspidata var. bicuspidata NRRL YB-4993 TaxID=869754 RepID=A0A1A0HBC7_9ASCO|nr:S-adenosyl-L-methionine-dependent methyltransferase [Metschnikowia bicuspidata var. bicuspidata NRRL YB-4993]OBA21316.1 S-adenosyl-L-methionine-dependent methyltransferase [Metschnikowia bicuspidata var. bicuspidata NRRL YB-4993]
MPVLFARRLTTTPGSSKNRFQVFDRAAKLVQRLRTPATDVGASRRADFLRDEVSLRTIERLAFITRDFTRTLDFGAHLGSFLKNLCSVSEVPESASQDEAAAAQQLNEDKAKVRLKIADLVMVDSLRPLLYRDAGPAAARDFPGNVVRVVADEEAFDAPELAASEQFDCVVSNLALHWINDLPQALANINRVLKPDGLFMGTIFGGDTLYELRTSLQLAELERLGGMSARVSPLVHVNDVGSLLSRAGFSMLTIDTEDIVVGGYPDLVALCTELQAMGEQNSLLARAHTLPRDVLLAANEIGKSLHGEKAPDGTVTIPATFNVIFMIGWKKSESQPQPLARGSGQINLKDVLQ